MSSSNQSWILLRADPCRGTHTGSWPFREYCKNPMIWIKASSILELFKHKWKKIIVKQNSHPIILILSWRDLPLGALCLFSVTKWCSGNLTFISHDQVEIASTSFFFSQFIINTWCRIMIFIHLHDFYDLYSHCIYWPTSNEKTYASSGNQHGMLKHLCYIKKHEIWDYQSNYFSLCKVSTVSVWPLLN